MSSATPSPLAPASRMFDTRTFVSDPESGPEPAEVNRRPSSALPPERATTNGPRVENSAQPPRTIGPVSYGSPRLAYQPRVPWERQRSQSSQDKQESSRYYQRNRSRLNQESKKNYRVVKTDRRFQTLRQDRRQDPEKYERQRALSAALDVEAYTPWSPSKRRHRQTGAERQQARQRYRRNKSKLKRQQRQRYKKLRRNPLFKRQRMKRRSQPGRYRLRVAAHVLTGYYGADCRELVVLGVSESLALVALEDGSEVVLRLGALLNGVVFDDADFDLLLSWVERASPNALVEELTDEDAAQVASLHGITDPEVLGAVGALGPEAWISLVLDATCEDDDDDPRVAAVYSREVVPASPPDQALAPGEAAERLRATRTDARNPAKGVFPKPDFTGFGPSSVVPEHLKRCASTVAELLRATAPELLSRAGKVRVKLVRADQGNLLWSFRAAGSERDYAVRVKAVGSPRSVQGADVLVSCDCDFFRYQGPEHWASVNGYLYGRPRGTASAPSERDPSGTNALCKHAVAALRAASKFKLSGR